MSTYGFLSFIPEDRDCGSARVVGIGGEVEVPNRCGVVDRVTSVDSRLVLLLFIIVIRR